MIRLIAHTDAEEIYKLVDRNREYLRRWLPWLDHNKSAEDTKTFIKTSLKDYAEEKSMVCVIINNDKISGVCGFNSINHTIKSGYLGYWISEDCQGKGLVYQSCIEMERIGFQMIGLNKIEIHAATGNKKSRNVAENLNYINTGTILDAEWLYDHYVDHEKNEYWIIRHGGVGGVSDFYGPGTINKE